MLAQCLPGTTALDLTPDEAWLLQRFVYWARRLAPLPNRERELLSELGTKLGALVGAPRGRIERILRAACMNVWRERTGRSAVRKQGAPLDEYLDTAPTTAPAQVAHYELIERLERLLNADIPPKASEALQLRALALSDDVASQVSRWPCAPPTFRKRLEEGRRHERKLSSEFPATAGRKERK